MMNKNIEGKEEKKSIVMVDDNNDNEKLYNTLFIKSNYNFEFISSSLEFLQKLNSNQFSNRTLIILDYNIDENYHGLDLLKKIREKKLNNKIVIFSSSASDELKRFDFSELLPVFYLDKLDYNGKKLINFCDSLLYDVK